MSQIAEAFVTNVATGHFFSFLRSKTDLLLFYLDFTLKYPLTTSIHLYFKFCFLTRKRPWGHWNEWMSWCQLLSQICPWYSDHVLRCDPEVTYTGPWGLLAVASILLLTVAALTVASHCSSVTTMTPTLQLGHADRPPFFLWWRTVVSSPVPQFPLYTNIFRADVHEFCYWCCVRGRGITHHCCSGLPLAPVEQRHHHVQPQRHLCLNVDVKVLFFSRLFDCDDYNDDKNDEDGGGVDDDDRVDVVTEQLHFPRCAAGVRVRT